MVAMMVILVVVVVMGILEVMVMMVIVMPWVIRIMNISLIMTWLCSFSYIISNVMCVTIYEYYWLTAASSRHLVHCLSAVVNLLSEFQVVVPDNLIL